MFIFFVSFSTSQFFLSHPISSFLIFFSFSISHSLREIVTDGVNESFQILKTEGEKLLKLESYPYTQNEDLSNLFRLEDQLQPTANGMYLDG